MYTVMCCYFSEPVHAMALDLCKGSANMVVCSITLTQVCLSLNAYRSEASVTLSSHSAGGHSMLIQGSLQCRKTRPVQSENAGLSIVLHSAYLETWHLLTFFYDVVDNAAPNQKLTSLITLKKILQVVCRVRIWCTNTNLSSSDCTYFNYKQS